MDGTDGWEKFYTAMVDEIGQGSERKLHDFGVSLGDWLYAVLNWPTDDWRDELYLLVEHTRYYGLEIEPTSLDAIRQLVESRISGTGAFAAQAAAGAQPAETVGPIQVAVDVAVDDGSVTDATLALDHHTAQRADQKKTIANDGAAEDTGGAILRPGDPVGLVFEGDQGVWANVLSREEARHFGYTYYRVAKLRKLFARLFRATQHLDFKANASSTAVASYQGLRNRINYRGELRNVSGLVAVHETIHAANDFAGIYTWNEEKDEALAWTAQLLLGFGAGRLRSFEDAIKNKRITSAKEAQDAWDAAWHPRFGLPGVLAFTIAWNRGRSSRAVTNADVIDVRNKLGIVFSAKLLKPAYERLLRENGISIRLQNRADIPAAFR